MGEYCDLNPKDYWYVILNPSDKKNKCEGGSLCQCGIDVIYCDEQYKNTIAFYATKRNDYQYPQSFIVTYSLTQDNLPKECAPGTYNLAKTLGTQENRGIRQISLLFPAFFRMVLKSERGFRAEVQLVIRIVFLLIILKSIILNCFASVLFFRLVEGRILLQLNHSSAQTAEEVRL